MYGIESIRAINADRVAAFNKEKARKEKLVRVAASHAKAKADKHG